MLNAVYVGAMIYVVLYNKQKSGLFIYLEKMTKGSDMLQRDIPNINIF